MKDDDKPAKIMNRKENKNNALYINVRFHPIYDLQTGTVIAPGHVFLVHRPSYAATSFPSVNFQIQTGEIYKQK